MGSGQVVLGSNLLSGHGGSFCFLGVWGVSSNCKGMGKTVRSVGMTGAADLWMARVVETVFIDDTYIASATHPFNQFLWK